MAGRGYCCWCLLVVLVVLVSHTTRWSHVGMCVVGWPHASPDIWFCKSDPFAAHCTTSPLFTCRTPPPPLWWCVAEADAARRTLQPPPSSTASGDREGVAAELAGIVQMPIALVMKALEMFGDDANQVMGWLMDQGRRYLPYFENGEAADGVGGGDWQEDGAPLGRYITPRTPAAVASTCKSTQRRHLGTGRAMAT